MHKKRRKTPAEKAAQRWRTANNKIKRIKKALETATGEGKKRLEARLNFWLNNKQCQSLSDLVGKIISQAGVTIPPTKSETRGLKTLTLIP